MGYEKNKGIKGARKQDKASQGKVEFQGFFEVFLDEDAVDDLKELIKEGIHLAVILEEFVSEGMKISIIDADGNGSVMCSVYCARQGDPDAGWGFSSWSNDVSKAILAAHYKFKVVIGDRTFLEFMDTTIQKRKQTEFK